MPRTLHLTLKKKWFDMILSGEKKEEYREIKPYWENRFVSSFSTYEVHGVKSTIWPKMYPVVNGLTVYDTVTFKNGYAANSPEIVIELLKISIKTGFDKWGAEPNKQYFVLSLGDIVSTKNIMKEREVGFYWVQWNYKWEIAQWIGNAWMMAGFRDTYLDMNMQQIDERKLINPN